MAWGFVQSAEAHQGSGSSLGVAPVGNIVSSNRLIVVAYVYGSGITLDHVSDSQGNQGAVAGKFDQVLSVSDTFNGHLYFLTAPITAAGADTITATASGTASFISLWVGEYSGLSTATGTSGVVDVSASNGGTLATLSPSSGTTGNVGATGELAVAAFGDTAAGACTLTSPGGWVERFNDTPTGSWLPLVVDDKTPTSGAGASATWTNSTSDGSNGFAAAIAVFALAGAVTARPPRAISVARQAVRRSTTY